MKPWLMLMLLFLVPTAALAAPVAVSTGEHPGFTRLVLQYGTAADWTLGRTADGYAIKVAGRASYDLSKVFDQIGKTRLAAIWADPADGMLHVGVACACHAMPFEFRPGIVVIDLKDGPPPRGSSFEQPLASGAVGRLTAPAAIRPRPRPWQAQAAVPVYDWTEAATGSAGAERGPAALPPPAPPHRPVAAVQNLGLAPLRQSLIEQLGRGASEGIVMMVVPESGAPGPAPQGPPGAAPSVQIHLGEASAPDVPGLVVRQKGQGDGAMTAAGAACLVDDRLDVASWGADDPVADQIGPAQSGLTGEFDRADPDAVRRAVRFNLYLGFGAEARALIRAFPTGDGDTAIWQSLARILDGEADGGSAFAGMAACDTAAALWAVLGDSGVLAADQTAKPAILRSFSALPAHLRRQLGPALADRFLAGGDVAAATAVREAILRAPGAPGPGVDLMQARIDAAGGDHAAAEARLDDLASQSGPATPEALAALVEQRAALGQPVTQAQVDTLQEFLRERRGGPQEARFLRALVIAQGASGDFDAAFRGLEAAPDAAAILWRMLAQAGPDSALLAHAVLGAGVRPPDGAAPVAAVIADRLLTLGLADWAAPWLQRAGDPPAVLRARLALAQDDAQQALAILKAVDGSDAAPLRAEALQRQGAERAAAEIYAALGQPDKQWSALGRAHDWQRLASDGPLAWRAAAALLLAPVGAGPGPGDGPPEGPLARDAALVTQSAATRDAIGKLLATVKSPALLHD